MKKQQINRPIPHLEFQRLRWRLLISYLGVMVAILGTSTLVIYEFFSSSLYHKLDHQLVNLADAAAHNLSHIKIDPGNLNRKINETLDHDKDLDIPWQDMRQSNQSIEWFDANRQLLGKAGKDFPSVPFSTNFHTFQQDDIRTLTIPVYGSKLDAYKQIQGYVRVSESTEDIEEEIEQLRWGLSLGGIISLALTAIGGWWLTKQSLNPIENSFYQLKQFTADASHELRSPLTAIKTSVEVIQTHPERIHPADIDKFKAIISATNQMTTLVADLLFLARNDSKPVVISAESILIPVDELLEDLVDFLQPQAEAKEIIIKADLQAGILVKGDGNQLRRLFVNLLENALQYTPKKGRITITMSKSDRFMIVSVEDTGIGMTPEDIKYVFDRFWRADKARLRHQGGSGLGLAIAQSIAQLHRGEISVSSQLGVGTSFRVRLPISS